MSDPKNRTIPDVINTYLIMLVIYCLDLFLLKSDLSVLGDNFYSRFVSFVVLFIILWVSKTPVDSLGLSKKKDKILGGLVFGAAFSVIPLIIVTVAEIVLLLISHDSEIIFNFSPPNINYIRSSNLPVVAGVIIYIFTTFFGSMFKEVLFRGFFLRKLKKTLDFNSANIIQAVLYMAMIVPYLLRNLVNHYYNNSVTVLGGIFLVCFYIVHETLAGIKWGMLTRVTGATYVSIVDHFLFVLLSNSFCVIDKTVMWIFMTHMLVMQVVSFVMVYLYYRKNMKLVLEKQAAEEAAEKERREARKAHHKRSSGNHLVDEKMQDMEEISPGQYKSIVNEATSSRRISRQHSERRNQAHARVNEDLIENIPNGGVKQRANEFLEQQLSKSATESYSVPPDFAATQNRGRIESYNHDAVENFKMPDRTNGYRTHSEARQQMAAKANEGKIEDLNEEKISEKANEYFDSLAIERKNPKHPNPNDSIAVDGLLSEEEIEHENSEKIGDFSENDIDDFLKSFNEDLKKERHHNVHSRPVEFQDDSIADIGNIGENFNADDFLREFQSRQSDIAAPIMPHDVHRTNHSEDKTKQVTNENEKTQTSEKLQDNAEKTVTKKKNGIFDVFKKLGEVDDSEENDLI